MACGSRLAACRTRMRRLSLTIFAARATSVPTELERLTLMHPPGGPPAQLADSGRLPFPAELRRITAWRHYASLCHERAQEKNAISNVCGTAVSSALAASIKGWRKMTDGCWTNCLGTFKSPNGKKYIGAYRDGQWRGQGLPSLQYRSAVTATPTCRHI